MRRMLLVAMSLLLVSCGQTSETASEPGPVSEATPAGHSSPATELPRNMMAMRGVDLYMHDYAPTEGELRDPTFWVHAESGQLAEGGKVWSLHRIRAVIYREDNEDLVVEARDAQVNQEEQVAALQGDVRLTAGTLVVDLEDLLWENEKGTATSDHPVYITDGDTRLEAQSLSINVDDGALILGEGSGFIRLTVPRP